MKKTIGLLCALAFSVGVVSAAPDRAEPSKPDSTRALKAKERAKKKSLAPQTGSRLQRTVDVSGRITTEPYQLIIISNEAIRRSGYAQLSQVFRSQGHR